MMRRNMRILVLGFVLMGFWQMPALGRGVEKSKLSYDDFLAKLYADFLAHSDLSSSDAKAELDFGLESTKSCEDKLPAVCHYYAGLFKREALLLRTSQPKTTWPAIINHFQTAAFLHESLDQGGPYRALGQAYLDFPKTPIWGKAFTQNLDTAWQYTAKSLKVAAQDPRNLYLAGRVRLAQKDYESALVYLKGAKAHLAEYKGSKAEKTRLKTGVAQSLKQATEAQTQAFR